MAPLFRIIALFTCLLVSRAWGAPPNPDLTRARQLLENLRYTEASRALDAARERPGNERTTLLQILELQGVVAAMLQQPAKARSAFQTLVVLAPDHQLMGDYAPRVVTPFFEAKGWVAEHGAALRLEAAPASKSERSVERVAARVTTDVLKLGRTVRFHFRTGGPLWREEERPLTESAASVEVSGKRVQWWAELLDERQAVLVTLGSANAPVTETALPLQALTHSPTDTPGLRSTPLRIASYVCLGVAAGTGAVGGYFGLRSRSARAEVEGAAVNDGGLTTGLTQAEAFALDARARSNARLANVLFGVAGAVAITGGTLWVLGAPVTVSATPTGVTLGGKIP
ncbi:MAG: hypothetical protein JXB05_38420 [Myxococcaceae bacterium]|nr:hypothetical protein [Myxococcaceae bacterium]